MNIRSFLCTSDKISYEKIFVVILTLNETTIRGTISSRLFFNLVVKLCLFGFKHCGPTKPRLHQPFYSLGKWLLPMRKQLLQCVTDNRFSQSTSGGSI